MPVQNKLRYWFLLFFPTVLLAITACKKKEVLPIDPDLLVEVLVDVHFAEAALSHVKTGKKDTTAQLYYNQIYERYQINEVIFDSSMAILKRDPLRMWKIYNVVQTRIDEKASDLQTE